MEIELKDFVAETLKQIVEGIILSQDFAKDKNAEIVPDGIYNVTSDSVKGTGILGLGEGYVNIVDFDIAVTASESAQTKSGIGVFITVIGSGVQGQNDASSSTLSRIKFVVPVLFPRQTND